MDRQESKSNQNGHFLDKMDFGGREEEEDDDILPDTNIDRERTTTGRWAIAMFVVAAAFTTVAFVTPNWIEADPRFCGTKDFTRVAGGCSIPSPRVTTRLETT